MTTPETVELPAIVLRDVEQALTVLVAPKYTPGAKWQAREALVRLQQARIDGGESLFRELTALRAIARLAKDAFTDGDGIEYDRMRELLRQWEAHDA